MSGHEEVPVPDGYPVQTIQQRVLIRWGPIWASTIGLITVVVVSLGLVRAFQLALEGGKQDSIHARYVDPDYEQAPGTAPLSPAQVAVKDAYLAKQQQILSSYGWVDQEAKVARIPIDQAKALVVKKYGKE